MTTTCSFQEQLQISKEYETLLMDFWKASEGFYKLNDVRDKKEYQEIDIDFILARIYRTVLKIRTIEVKVDFRMSETGNIFIEQGKKGWLNKCKAEILAYIDATKDMIYYIDTENLKVYMTMCSDRYQTRSVNTSDFGGYSVTGWIVPTKDIVSNLHPLMEKIV